jgi:HTH-type transcriptional regulator/antitoxin HipB
MAQGKRISSAISGDAQLAIKELGAAARQARLAAGEGQAAADARLGVHVQTIGRIEAGEPGVAVGHVVGMLALYGLRVRLEQPSDQQRANP